MIIPFHKSFKSDKVSVLFRFFCKSNIFITTTPTGLYIFLIKNTKRFANCRPPAHCYIAKTLKPPSTTATVPVTNFAASLIR